MWWPVHICSCNNASSAVPGWFGKSQNFGAYLHWCAGAGRMRERSIDPHKAMVAWWKGFYRQEIFHYYRWAVAAKYLCPSVPPPPPAAQWLFSPTLWTPSDLMPVPWPGSPWFASRAVWSLVFSSGSPWARSWWSTMMGREQFVGPHKRKTERPVPNWGSWRRPSGCACSCLRTWWAAGLVEIWHRGRSYLRRGILSVLRLMSRL